MGTGYTRNDTANNIADGNVINAADFDGEYDAIEAAFNSSTGHTHDGTAAEGAPITVLGPSQEFVATSSEVKPSTNAGLDLGTSGLKFKDLYLDGTAYIDGLGGNLLVDTTNALQFRDAQLAINSNADGQLDIAADTTTKITSPEVIVTDDFRLQSDASILTFGADDDVSVTHVADTGLDAKAASGFTLRLQTGDTTVESGNTIGKISFNAPDEASGTDAILVGAEIEAAAEDTFSSTVNSTALVFKTNTSAAATERMRIKANGDIVIQGANYDITWDNSSDVLRFDDNAKLTFGASDDLQIFHNSSHSIIQDVGDGNLYIRTNGTAVVIDDGSSTNLAAFNSDSGEAALYWGGTTGAGKKLATTTDGIDVTGDISVGNLNVDTNTISSTDTNGDINLSPNGTGTVVINTDLDVDNININGNSITSTDTNGDINITPNGTGKVNISGNFEPSDINLISTDGGATAGPSLKIDRQSSSPADNDLIGEIKFLGRNDADQEVQYAQILSYIADVTDATEDGALQLNHIVNGASRVAMSIKPSEVVFNDQHDDVDFRIEGDTNPNLFFVDASEESVGIGTNSSGSWGAAQNQLVVGDGTGDNGITIYSQNSANGNLRFSDGTTGSQQYSGRVEYDHVNDKLFLGAGGTTPVVLTSGENFGIGTNDPDDKLEVAGDITLSSGSPEITFETTSASHYNWQIAAQENISNAFEIGVGSQDGDASNDTFSPKFSVHSDGNVGIGTGATALTERLEVWDDDAVIKIRDTSAYAENTGPKINFQAYDSASSMRAVGEVIGAATDSTNEGRLIFNTRSGGSLVETMRLTEDRDAIVTAGGITLTDDGHGVNIDYVGSLPAKAGIFTSSTAHSQTAYGDLNVKARSDYGNNYSIGFFTASSAGSPTKRASIHSNGNWYHPQEERYINDSGIIRFQNSTTVNETATTVFTITKVSYAYYIMGNLKVMLVDTGSPWGVYYREIKLAGRSSTFLAGNNMNLITGHEENVATLDYTPTFSVVDTRTSGSSGGTWEYKLATGSGNGTASAKVTFTGYVAGATLS